MDKQAVNASMGQQHHVSTRIVHEMIVIGPNIIHTITMDEP